MTTPTTQTPEQFREELRKLFTDQAQRLHELRIEFIEMREELHTMREGLTHAATPPAASGQTETVTMTRITRTRTNGKWYYKMQGGRYMKRGVTIWDEVLKALDLNPDSIAWDAQDGYTFPQPLTVAVLLKEYADETSGELKTTPQKVTGKV